MNDCTSLAEDFHTLLREWDGMAPDLLGPVSDREIARAERALGVALPPSFRAFLSQFGGGFVFDYEILGLADEPGHWLDIVQMNHSPRPGVPRHCVLFLYAGGSCAYYLDTSRRDADGECPVVVFGLDAQGVPVADSFLDFLRMAKDRVL